MCSSLYEDRPLSNFPCEHVWIAVFTFLNSADDIVCCDFRLTASDLAGVDRTGPAEPDGIKNKSTNKNHKELFLPLDETIASRAVFVILSGADGNAFGAS